VTAADHEGAMSTAILYLAGSGGGLELDADVLQGSWTNEQYLRLTDRTNRLIEFVDGRLEALPMPTDEQQGLLLWLVDLLRAAIGADGVVRVAPLRVQVAPGRFREPDLLALRDADDPRRRNGFWRGADLVVEIVSPDDPDRDYVDKRGDYALAEVAEYWIVDPAGPLVTLLSLSDTGEEYVVHARSGPGGSVTSRLVPGLTVDVSAMLAAVAAPPD
jgi:Uma2 family endonuclease